TNYLSAPNLINACNPHIGTVYRVVFEQFNQKRSTYIQQSHTIQTLIRAFDPTTGDAYQTLAVHSWPLVSKKSLNLAAKIITGDKINAILALCQLVKKCINQEALGEYSGFFKFAKQLNRYHPKPYAKTGKDSFDLAYKYHYNTTPVTPSQLHIRHFPETAQQFLKKLHAGSKAHAKVAKTAQWLQAIAWNQQTGQVHIPYETDLRLVCDQLLSTVLDNPGLKQIAGGPTSLYTTNLLSPPAVSFFLGRAQELRVLRQCFQANQELILAPPITGPGGIGKTQLALRVVKQQVEEQDYAHVFWIPAESEEKLLDAYLRMADGLGMYVDKKDQKQAVQTVRLHLKDRHCLYVFDDAPDIGKLRDFLPLAKGHVLITSRNSAKEDWNTQPIQMNPLREQEALTLAQEFGYGQSKEEQAALKPLLAKVPCYPLTLVQLFSMLETEGYDAAGWLTAMEQHAATAQEEALISLLAERPHARIGYAQSMIYVIKTSLERLEKEQQGVKALHLISQLAYLDPKGIPLAWLLTWDKEDTVPLKRKTRAALSLLEKYSLIQWDRNSQQVYIHAETQLMVRYLYPQESLTVLINHLVAYTGDKEQAFQSLATWASLLPHGRMLFKRLDTAQCPQEAYVLAKYLDNTCYVVCLFEEELFWTKKQLEIAQKRHTDRDHPQIAKALENIGRGLRHISSLHKSLEYHKRALEMQKRIYKDQDHPDMSQSLNSMGVILWKSGKHQEALVYLKQALTMQKRLYPQRDDLIMSIYLRHVGCSLSELCKHEEALAYYKQALEIRKRIYEDQDHFRLAESLDDVGITLAKLGKSEEALAYCMQALSMIKRIFKGRDHKWVAITLNDMGVIFEQLRKHEEALNYYKQAAIMALHIYQRDHYLLSDYLNNLIRILNKVQEKALTQELIKEVDTLCIQVLGAEHALTQQLRKAGELVFNGDGY
ncbi:MAG: tetratricopeptide repeat protein, partial [Bacteroidota bacterium]